MLKRQTKSFTEKESVITFGQFILPLAVVIALAMLFFSIKLFFYTPIDTGALKDVATEAKEADDKEIARIIKDKKAKEKQREAALQDKETESGKQAEEPLPAEDKQNEKKQAGRQDKEDRVKLPDASPVSVSPDPSLPVSKTAPSASAPVQPPAQKTNAPAAKSDGIRRWDIQIGSFEKEEAAVAQMKKAAKDGFDPYYGSYKKDGKERYRVRVRGTANRAEAELLKDRLAKKGYETSLVGLQ